jgi:RNA polymerase sigma-70 factor (ECF subfamily)
MGRHAAERPAPDSASVPSRTPAHADLFAPSHRRPAVSAAEARAAAAFELLVGPHRGGLREYVLRLTDGDESAAESVVKETLYRAAQDPSRYPQRPAAVRAWLVLIARAVIADGERLAPAGLDDRPPVWTPMGGPPYATPPPPTTVVAAMDELASTHRDILVELFYRGVSLEDAARVRNVPVETVKTGLYFAMRALRAVLDQQVADRHER